MPRGGPEAGSRVRSDEGCSATVTARPTRLEHGQNTKERVNEQITANLALTAER